MNILFFQYGNFGEAYTRFAQGGPETFRDQRASVDYVAQLAERHAVTVVAICGQPHDTFLTGQLRSVGVTYDSLTPGRIAEMFDRLAPDRVICRTPHAGVLREVAKRGIAILPTFADMFESGGLRQSVRNFRLRRRLQRLRAPCISNHSLNASLSVARALAWPKARVVPWDRRVIRSGFAPKRGASAELRLFYAGALTEAKGLGDVITALSCLKARGVVARLTVAGAGDWDRWHGVAMEAGVESQVRYAGVLPNTSIVAEMNAHDMVLVPSRHAYPEGLPNTLREGLASRSPVIASDHPAFADRLRDRKDALIFKAGSPEALAEAVQTLQQSNGLFAELSQNAPAASHGLRFGMYWDDLWTAFIEDPDDQTGWTRKHSLEAMLACEGTDALEEAEAQAA